MFSTIKAYLYGAVAVIIAIAVAVFKYRGNKIDGLEVELEAKVKEAEVTAKVTENKISVAVFEAANKVEREKADEDNIKEFDAKHPIGNKFYI